MFKKILLAVALIAGTSFVMAPDASADHCSRGYSSYGGLYAAPVVSYRAAPVVSYRAPVYRSSYGHRSFAPYPAYRPGYSSFYGSPYRSGYRGGFGGYGYGYGRGTSIGIGRGGVSLNFGF